MTIRGERGVIATVGADAASDVGDTFGRSCVVVTVVGEGGSMQVLRLDANHAEAFEAAVRAARLEVLATAVSP